MKRIKQVILEEKKSKDIAQGFNLRTSFSVILLYILMTYSQLPDSNWAYCFVWNITHFDKICVLLLSILEIIPTVVLTFAFQVDIQTMYNKTFGKRLEENSFFVAEIYIFLILLTDISTYAKQQWCHLLFLFLPEQHTVWMLWQLFWEFCYHKMIMKTKGPNSVLCFINVIFLY